MEACAMSSDVIDLRDFYRSDLGQIARHMIRRAVRRVWPDLEGMRLLGIGYPTPFLAVLLSDTERTVAVMPASQGVLGWPAEGRNLVTLADEGELPFADCSIDRVLMVHALESSEEARGLLREVWRVLAGGGRLLIVVPNRRGIWARFDRTPFGFGRPYTASQLSQLLRGERFIPVSAQGALYIPPARSRTILRAAPVWERIGKRFFPSFAGVVLVEAAKEIYARPAAAARRPRRRLVYTPAAHGLSRQLRQAREAGQSAGLKG
jgi:SAM-dependent methyltransferase